MKASDLRRRYIDFFVQKHGHAEILGASLLPENDPTVLFTTAGMHPLVPYLMGASHPEGRRLVDVQNCVRTGDIDEVGDDTHFTFFEMLGNWSLGDYFKKESILMSYEFLTAPLEEGGLGLDPDRLAVSVFAGDDDAPRDEEAAQAWEALGFVRADEAEEGQKRRIYFYNKKENWWGPAGLTGPCGPDTEIFYYNSDDEAAMWQTQPSDDETPWVEIWNNVFMQYNKTEAGDFEPLSQQNVDTGMGLERVTAILQGKATAYETELFAPVLENIRQLADNSQLDADWAENSARVVADHLRSATFIMGDERGIEPSNHDQGYVLRRLIRRAIRHGQKLGIGDAFCVRLVEQFIDLYAESHPLLDKNRERVLKWVGQEEEKFQKTLVTGEQELLKDVERAKESFELMQTATQVAQIEKALNGISQLVNNKAALALMNKSLRPILGKLRSEFQADAAEKTVEVPSEVRDLATQLAQAWELRGDRAFYYFETFGFPLEMTVEMMAEHGIQVDKEGFEKAFTQHQEKSRAGAEQKFAGGLADHSFETRKLHTATHLMLEALRQVLGSHVEQKGSNITQERLRFDFNHPEKLNPEQIAEVERIVNDAIQADHPVSFKEMSLEEARKINATGVFVDKYEGQLEGQVKVYFMGDFSTEICGGPHVEHTGQLGTEFKIKKEESSSSGIRRIKAILR